MGLQIDSGMPAAFLLLHHQAAELSDYEWHWFLLTGYQRTEDGFLVKAVTYGEYQWLDFGQLWIRAASPGAAWFWCSRCDLVGVTGVIWCV